MLKKKLAPEGVALNWVASSENKLTSDESQKYKTGN